MLYDLVEELLDDDVGIMVAELMYELLDDEVEVMVAELLYELVDDDVGVMVIELLYELVDDDVGVMVVELLYELVDEVVGEVLELDDFVPDLVSELVGCDPELLSAWVPELVGYVPDFVLLPDFVGSTELV